MFRDLNKNGRLDVYEDPSQPIDAQVEGLLGQMTLEEKAGLMFHDFIPTSLDGSLVEGESPRGPYPNPFSTSAALMDEKLNHFLVMRFPQPREMCVGEPAAGARRADTARDSGHTFFQSRSRVRQHPGDRHVRELLLTLAGADWIRCHRRRER